MILFGPLTASNPPQKENPSVMDRGVNTAGVTGQLQMS